MHASYPQEDTSWEEPLDNESTRPSAKGAVVTGLLGLVGGGLLSGGVFLDYVTVEGQTTSVFDDQMWPGPVFYLGASALAALAGLIALLAPRRPLGSAAVGLVLAPAAIAGALHAAQILTARQLVDEKLTDVAELGMWLLAAGVAVSALAAVVALVVAAGRMRPTRGTVLPVVGGLAGTGLLAWWAVPVLWSSEDGSFSPVFGYLDNGSRDTWIAVATIIALGLVGSAVAVAAGRAGAAAVGVACGATLTVGLEFAARYLTDTSELADLLNGETRLVPNAIAAAAGGVLLLLTIGLGVVTANQPAETSATDPSEAWATPEYSGTSSTETSPSSGAGSSWGQADTSDPWAGTDTSTTTWDRTEESTTKDWKSDEDAGQSWSSQR